MRLLLTMNCYTATACDPCRRMISCRDLEWLLGCNRLGVLDPLLLWAKTASSGDEAYLPLPHHLYDVAAVTWALLDNVHRHTLSWLADMHGVEPEWLKKLLVFLCGAHDLGKATPFFQIKSDAQASRLRRHGVVLKDSVHRLHVEKHGEATYGILVDFLKGALESQPTANRLALAVSAHHGTTPQAILPDDRPRKLGTKPSLPNASEWATVQARLVEDIARRCEFRPQPLHEVRAPLLAFLAGLCSVADWIGSDQSEFPVTVEAGDVRWEAAAERAANALKNKGLGPRQVFAARRAENLFPFDLNTIQTHVQAISAEGPRLVLIEAVTGDGKTEAAMILAEAWRDSLKQNGAYFALPTQGTSNQMFMRVVNYLSGLPGDKETHLLHGKSYFNDAYEHLRLSRILDDGEDGEEDGRAVASEFLAGPKRGLLGQFGVGTIDQGLLAAIRAKHGFIRLFALARKTVVIDEVHAYDLYMSQILDLLLAWLAALDCTVVLLSATLPAARRQQLFREFGALSQLPETGFPRITYATAEGTPRCVHTPSLRKLRVRILWKHLPEALNSAMQRARAGDCVAIVCNTVGRAQQIYRNVKAQCEESSIQLDLFHARFPYADRQEIENRCVRMYGKDLGERPRGAILVATQVVEQSLDVDFDFMISEVAPVDLLIQRAGRLHRHSRERRSLPELVLIVPPANEAGVPDFEGSGWVYERIILLRTLLLLRERDSWALPDESDELIEAVYGEEPIQIPEHMRGMEEKAIAHKERGEARSTIHAETQKIEPPSTERFMASYSAALDEDDPTKHVAFQAVTREGSPSVLCICLHELESGVKTVDAGGEIRTQPLNARIVKAMAERSVELSHRKIYSALLSIKQPAGWKQNAVFKHARPLDFRNGVVALPDSPYVLIYDRCLGISIEGENGST
jgi:CRISPR-associated endonuclease/helicase Cas3